MNSQDTLNLHCPIPTSLASLQEKIDYAACRAKSLAYQAAELSVSLERLGRFSQAKGARHIVQKLTELEKSIKTSHEASTPT